MAEDPQETQSQEPKGHSGEVDETDWPDFSGVKGSFAIDPSGSLGFVSSPILDAVNASGLELPNQPRNEGNEMTQMNEEEQKIYDESIDRTKKGNFSVEFANASVHFHRIEKTIATLATQASLDDMKSEIIQILNDRLPPKP